MSAAVTRARLGILSSEFDSPTLSELFDAVAAAGARSTQFHFASAFPEIDHHVAVHRGLIEFGERIGEVDIPGVRAAAEAAGVAIVAVDGTFNMIHPDPALRERGYASLARVIELAPRLGAGIVTLSTGTRNRDSMWLPDPGNTTDDAWRDLVTGMSSAARVAEANGVTLAFEPEMGNVVHSAELARRLMDEVRSPRVKVLFDAANIYHHGELQRGAEVLRESLQLIGSDVVLAHAKDLDHDGEAGGLPAGLGRLDYPAFLRLLEEHDFAGSIILHALAPRLGRLEFPERFAFVRGAAPSGYLE